MTQDDRQKMRSYYDEFGDAELERLEKAINGRVSLEVHRQFLTRFISHSDRVLRLGAAGAALRISLVGWPR